MGTAYTERCPKCGFEYHSSTGVGFMFPMVYVETVKKAKEGDLGKDLQDFFKEHKDGAINAEFVDLCCKECGHLSGGMDLTMYIPNKKKPETIKHGRWTVGMSFEDVDYVDWLDLEKYYTEYAQYPHKCEKCGGSMKILKNNEELKCPYCKVPLEITNTINWD